MELENLKYLVEDEFTSIYNAYFALNNEKFCCLKIL